MRMGRSYVCLAALAAGIVLMAIAAPSCSSSSVSSGDDASAEHDAGQADSRMPDAPFVDAPETSSPEAAGPDTDGTQADAAAKDAGADGGEPSDGAGPADGTGPPEADGDADSSAEGGLLFSCTSATPSLARSVSPLLVSNCGGELCHGGTLAGAFGGAQGAYRALVNVMATRDKCDASVLVSPGSLSRSYLMNKLTGVGICPGTMRMPPNHGAPLPTAEIQTIADWICSGAPNN